MSVWKLQCHLCGDTVSTGKLNRNYYKMHLEAVHNVQQHGEGLLQWALSQQSVEDNVGSTVSAVANIMSMKGISIQRSADGTISTPKGPVPGPLLNIKGITVQRVEEQGGGVSSSNTVSQNPQHQSQSKVDALRAQQSAAQLRQQEQAINRWANGCEHGCRICRKNGKNFTSFTKQGLLKHLESEHEVSERDYKEEFKCLNLITRASNTSCKECGARIKRIPTSLNMHFKKHGLNIRTYWLKHLKPPTMPVLNGASPLGRGGIPLSGRGSRPRGPRGGMVRGMSKPGIHKCTMPNCTRSFDNVTALNLHRSWHGRGGRGRGRGRPGMQPVVVLNRVDGEKEPAGEEMVMEMDPMDMLEVGIGDADDERGEEVEVDLDNLEVVDDDGVPAFDDDATDPIEITPVQTEDDTETPSEVQNENENGDLDTSEAVGDSEAPKENQSDAESDIELVASFTPSVADPRMPIPLPDQTKDPPGTHIPPLTPPPIRRLPTPDLKDENKIADNEELNLQEDLGLDSDVEVDEDGAPIIHKKTETESKFDILDQIENEIQEKIKSQEASKVADVIGRRSIDDENEKDKLQDDKSANQVCQDLNESSDKGEPYLKKLKVEDGSVSIPDSINSSIITSTNNSETVVKTEDSKSVPDTKLSHCVASFSDSEITNNSSDNVSKNDVPSLSEVSVSNTQSVDASLHSESPNSDISCRGDQSSIPETHASQHDPARMNPNQPYPSYDPLPNREHYYQMHSQPPSIPNQPPMIQSMQSNYYSQQQHTTPFVPQHQQSLPLAPPTSTFQDGKQTQYFPYTGYATPIHTFNDTVEPGPDGRLPLDYWTTMSCTVDIPNCPLNCCHVRAHQEIMEGSTNWKELYGPPLNGLQPCSCCINT